METSFASASKSRRLLAETRSRICPKGSTSARWISEIRTRLIKPCGVILKCYRGRGWITFRFRKEFVNVCSRNLSIFSTNKLRWFKFVKYPQPHCTCQCGFLRFSIFYFTNSSFCSTIRILPHIEPNEKKNCLQKTCFVSFEITFVAISTIVYFFLSLKVRNNSNESHHFFLK